jgi:hypothetical protein
VTSDGSPGDGEAPFARWQERWFGVWREFGAGYERCPSIEEFVDASWAHPRRADIVEYLSDAPIVATTSRLAIPWATGSGDGRQSVSYRSDGEWLWLDDLGYYVEHHGVRLPDAFVAAIEARSFVAPAQLDRDPSELAWPPVG